MEYKLTRVKLEKEKDERQCSQNQIFFLIIHLDIEVNK